MTMTQGCASSESPTTDSACSIPLLANPVSRPAAASRAHEASRRRRGSVVAPAASILIVDDEFGLAEMLREMLRESGFEVTLAINGRLALEILKEVKVDLVLTDMMMPVMDGAELAAAMRSDDRYRDTPVIMMTSLPT